MAVCLMWLGMGGCLAWPAGVLVPAYIRHASAATVCTSPRLCGPSPYLLT